jgi:Undecaprenyl-phosphate glucose phosphotransferase
MLLSSAADLVYCQMSDGIKLHEKIGPLYRSVFPLRFSDGAIGVLFAAVDAVSITAASLVSSLVYYEFAYNEAADGVPGQTDVFFGLGIVAAILYLFVAKSWGLYGFAILVGFDRPWGRLVASWILVVLLLVLFMFLLKIGASFSRGTMLVYAVSAPVFVIGARTIAARYLRTAFERGAPVGRRAVVIGDRDQLAALTSLDLARRFAIAELGRVTLPAATTDAAALAARDSAAAAHAIDLARREMADEVVLAVSWADARRLDLLRESLRILPLPVRLLPDRTVGEILKQPIVHAGASLAVEMQRSPLTIAEQLQKRLFDVVLATAALLLLAPLFIAAAIAIKLESPGPVIFRQRRNGFNGRQFVIFKFRSMNVLEDGAAIEQARPRDPRVTRIGHILRRASIDELPQLYNVIRGEMSLVSPRPHALAHDDKYSELIAEYAFRHHMKPGITGWAQINGYRGETVRVEQMQKRVEYDLWYIDNWSLWLDFTVLVRTSFEVMRGRMAY